MLHVDLKTIHNWVAAGYLNGRRTEGRHLRFDRIEVVRFMRGFGYPVPKAISATPPTVLFVDSPGVQRSASVRTAQVFGAFDAALYLGTGRWEFAAVDLRVLSRRGWREWTGAVRRLDVTQTTGLIGVGRARAECLAFVEAGADGALASQDHRKALGPLIRWMIGATSTLPAGAVLPSEPDE